MHISTFARTPETFDGIIKKLAKIISKHRRRGHGDWNAEGLPFTIDFCNEILERLHNFINSLTKWRGSKLIIMLHACLMENIGNRRRKSERLFLQRHLRYFDFTYCSRSSHDFRSRIFLLLEKRARVKSVAVDCPKSAT